jgi:hypothetical protein
MNTKLLPTYRQLETDSAYPAAASAAASSEIGSAADHAGWAAHSPHCRCSVRSVESAAKSYGEVQKQEVTRDIMLKRLRCVYTERKRF